MKYLFLLLISMITSCVSPKYPSHSTLNIENNTYTDKKNMFLDLDTLRFKKKNAIEPWVDPDSVQDYLEKSEDGAGRFEKIQEK